MTPAPTTPEAALSDAIDAADLASATVGSAPEVLADLRASGWDVVKGWQPISGMPPFRCAMVGRWCGGGSFPYWHQVLANWGEIQGRREWSYADRQRPSPFYDANGNYAEPTHFHEIPPPPAVGATP